MMKNDSSDGSSWFNEKYRVFTDKPPTWNPKCNAYVYNFRGRVSQASIKNFQIVPYGYTRETSTELRQDYIVQFGKRKDDEFILDVQFPFSIFQAFGLALSAFDAD